VDLRELLHKRLLEQRRPPDGLLHASGDLLSSLRHTEIASDIRLMTGTMWHAWIAEALVKAGVPFMQEVRLAPWMPEGWSGTADAVFYDAERRAFVLGDYKTTKGEAIRWITKGGAKDEHLWQLSSYWHALYDMGLPLVKGFGVLYLPMNDTADRDERIEPVVVECEPIDRDTIYGLMRTKWELCQEYLASRDGAVRAGMRLADTEDYLTDKLAPEMARVQKIVWDGKKSVFEVKLVPHWSTQFCPYPEELCSCSTQGTTKIGHYTLDGAYEPRSGYEHELPMVEPSEKDYRYKRADAEKEAHGSSTGG
jgi:hypothetical protein